MNAADMLAPSEVLVTHWRRPFLRWLDGIEAGWAIPLLLIGFVGVWLAFLTIANFNGDLHPDTLQVWSSGRSLEWGYAQHAPLAAWLTHAWTSTFPLTNWSFRLLALINAVLALWSVDLISRRFVRGDRRVMVLLILMLLPIYQFEALRFDANAVLLAAWPISTYCFLRSFETRRIEWAVFAGLTAALTLLGKQHSVFLIASFVVAASCHPRRRAYLASPAPWVSAAMVLTAIVPHVHWLTTIGAKPFGDGLLRLTAAATPASLIEALLVVLVLAFVVATPLAIWGMMVPGRLSRLSRVLWIIDPGQLLLLFVGVGTIIFPAITAVGLGLDIRPAWEFQGLYLLVILVVCGSNAPIARAYTVNLAALATAMAVISVVVAAPLYALYRNAHPSEPGRNFYQLSAAELTRLWHAQTAEPLSVVGGDRVLALAAAFYSPDHPAVEDELVRPEAENAPPQATIGKGWASLCFEANDPCIAAMEGIAARASLFTRSDFIVQSNLLGLTGAQQGFAALVVPRSIAVPPAVATSPVAEAPSIEAPLSASEAPPIASLPPVAEAPAIAASPFVEASPPAATAPSLAASPLGAEPAPSVAASRPAEEKTVPPAASLMPEGSGEDATVAEQQQIQSRAMRQSEMPVRELDMSRGRAPAPPLVYKRARAAAARAMAEYKLNSMRWAAQRAARFAAARGQLVSSAGLDDPTSFSGCNRGPGDPSLSPAMLARLSQGLCSLAGFFAAHAQHPQQQMPAGQPRARTPTADAPRLPERDRAGFAEAAGHVPK